MDVARSTEAVKVCTTCGTPQQWEMWPKCACGGEFSSEGLGPGNVSGAIELERRRFKRESQRKLFANAPRNTLFCTAFASVASIIFELPPASLLMIIPIGYVIGYALVSALLTARPWIFYAGLFGLLLARSTIEAACGIETFGPSLALTSWGVVGVLLPFWIKRRRGMAFFAPLTATEQPIDPR